MPINTTTLRVNTKGAVQNVNKLSTSWINMASKITVVSSVFSGLTSVISEVGSAVKESHDRAIKLERSFKSIGLLGRSVFNVLKLETAGLVDDLTLVNSASKLMSLNLGLSIKDLSNLYKWSIGKGQALGRSANEAVEDITRGMATLSAQVLENLGIVLPKNLKTVNAKIKEIMKQVNFDLQFKGELFNLSPETFQEKSQVISNNLKNILNQFSLVSKGASFFGSVLDLVAKKTGKSVSEIRDQFRDDLGSAVKQLQYKLSVAKATLYEAQKGNNGIVDIKQTNLARKEITRLNKEMNKLVMQGKSLSDYFGIKFPKVFNDIAESFNKIAIEKGQVDFKAIREIQQRSFEEFLGKSDQEVKKIRDRLIKEQEKLYKINQTSKASSETLTKFKELSEQLGVLDRLRSSSAVTSKLMFDNLKKYNTELQKNSKFYQEKIKQNEILGKSENIFNQEKEKAILKINALIVALKQEGKQAQATQLIEKKKLLENVSDYSKLVNIIKSIFSITNKKENTKNIKTYVDHWKNFREELRKIQTDLKNSNYNENIIAQYQKRREYLEKLLSLHSRARREYKKEFESLQRIEKIQDQIRQKSIDFERKKQTELKKLWSDQIKLENEYYKDKFENQVKNFEFQKNKNSQVKLYELQILEYKKIIQESIKNSNFELFQEYSEKIGLLNTKIKQFKDQFKEFKTVKVDKDLLSTMFGTQSLEDQKSKLLADLDKQKEQNNLNAYNRDLQELNMLEKKRVALVNYGNTARNIYSTLGNITNTTIKAMFIEDKALRKLKISRTAYIENTLKTQLKSMALNYGIKAVGELAEAVAMSFWNPAGASLKFKSAGLYAIASGMAGLGSAALKHTNTASETGGGSTGSANYSDPYGGKVENKGTVININISESILGEPDQVASKIKEMISDGQDRGTVEKW